LGNFTVSPRLLKGSKDMLRMLDDRGLEQSQTQSKKRGGDNPSAEAPARKTTRVEGTVERSTAPADDASEVDSVEQDLISLFSRERKIDSDSSDSDADDSADEDMCACCTISCVECRIGNRLFRMTAQGSAFVEIRERA
jgi:hypothetical protein